MAFDISYKREMVRQEQCRVYFEDCYTLKELSEVVQNLVAEYGEGAFIEYYAEPYSNSDKEYPHITKDVPETDEQMNKRIAEQEKFNQENEKRKLAMYRQLREEFGDKA